MNGEEFLTYIGESNVFAKGKSRTNLIKERYLNYIKAYQVKTYLEAFWLHMHSGPSWPAAVRGLNDKDLGRPMVSVPELL